MKRVFYFVLFLSVIFLIYSCDSKSVEKDIIGTWYPLSKYGLGREEYFSFKENGVFETKASKILYLPLGIHSLDPSDMTIPQKMSFNYQIDSIDEIGGSYYRIYSKDNNFSERKYAIVDNDILFNCSIKPIPSDNNYIYHPKVYVNNLENSKEIELSYFNQNIVFLDSLSEGDYYIYYNKLSGKSNIKKENSNLVITHEGITELDKFFDVRYFALRKYRAYIKRNKDLIEIPVIYYSSDFSMIQNAYLYID